MKFFHFDLQGKRESKYDYLNSNDLITIKWNKLEKKTPNYFFTVKDFSEEKNYNKGFSINHLFVIKAAGIKTHRDSVVIGFNPNELKNQIETFLIETKNTKNEFSVSKCKTLTYRPFDNRIIYYDTEFVERHRQEQIRHSFFNNYSLIIGRQTKNRDINHFFITDTLSEMKTAESSTGSYHFPLYIYPEKTNQTSTEEQAERKPNLNEAIMEKIAKDLNLAYIEDDNWVVDLAEGFSGTLYPTDILDYIYAVLHSPTYREKYKEFLKIDFPRVPYPKTLTGFETLSELGSQLRQLHLLESDVVNKPITKYPVSGDNVVDKIGFEHTPNPSQEGKFGKVQINGSQYFMDVPEVAWNFYIGGYQPAQKWLKDRKGRALSFEDIMHYQKIIVSLTETDRLMKEVDKVGVE